MRFLAVLLLFLFPFVSLAYEPTQTHAGLTEQVIEFYNLYSANKISFEQKELIIKGAMEEDDPSTRALNHFYDPIRNIGIEGGRTAKSWALDDLEANSFSWDEAIAAYARGDTNAALVALGHNIHLIEDMGVPDHTRNDQHLPFLDEDMGGHSPYEDWAAENKNRQTMQGLAGSFVGDGAILKRFLQVGEYFDFLANYSNKNFFSRDTIESKVYSQPLVTKNDGKYFYGIDDLSNSEAKLFGTFDKKDGTQFFALNSDKDFSILSSYFDRLSRQIIPSGAGVIELFFKEGELARIAYQAELRRQQAIEAQANADLARSLSQKGFFGTVWSGMVFLAQDNIARPVNEYVVWPVGNTLAGAARWAGQELPVVTDTASFAAVTTSRAAKEKAALVAEQTAQKTAQAFTIIQQTINKTFNMPVSATGRLSASAHSFGDAAPLSQEPTAFSAENAVDKSISASPKKNSIPRLVFLGNFSPGFGGGASPQVLSAIAETPATPEETLDTSEAAPKTPLPIVAPPQAPTLTAPQCAYSLATDGCLLATTTVRFEWSEVFGASHYAVNKNGAYATTTSTAFQITAPDFSDYLFEIAAIADNGQTSATSSQRVSVATIPLAINEIAWMGTVAAVDDEWFEIKNNTAHTIDLSQWALNAKVNAKDSTPYVKLTGTVAPRAYIIFERTNDTAVADITAHQTYTGALGNSGEQLNLSYASTTLDQTPEGAWAAVDKSTTTRKTMERYASKEPGANPMNWGTNLGYVKNGEDAEENLINGTPGAQNSVSTLINKGEDITSNFTLTADEERYVVPDMMTVAASTTLTIAPGVTVSFLNDMEGHDGSFFVQGAVDARGTADNPVVFNSALGNQAGGFWFDNGMGTSTFEHANFENTGDIGLDATGVEIRSANFVHTDGGINLYGNSTAIIENANFASTTDDAIGLYDGSAMRIASSTITNQLDGDAIGVYGGSSLTVVSTTIDVVRDGDGIGIYEGTLVIASSTIQNVSGDGIGLYDATSTISNVVITGGEGDGIGVYGGTGTISDVTVSGFENGSGIIVLEPQAPVAITGGEIFDNDVGITMDKGAATLDTTVSVHDNTQNFVIFLAPEPPPEDPPAEELSE